jgi:N6-adenosine-specific RNA methylase IME4
MITLPTRYRTVVSDPPWPYRDQLTMAATKRGAASQYRTMSVPEICAMGTSAPRRIAGYQVGADAFLWLWVTNPILLDGTGARVCKAWGFEPRQLITWVKGRIAIANSKEEETHVGTGARFIPQIGLGHFTRGCTEHLILATRGKTKALLQNKRTPNVLIAPRGRHSEKPQAAFDLIEQLTPGPYLELFARRRREGWESHGDQLPEEFAA